MKKTLLLLLLLPLTLIAQEVDDAIFKLENDPPFFPCSFAASYVDVNKTHVTSHDFEGKELIFRQWETAGVHIHPLSPVCGLTFGAGWVGAELNLENNTDFHQIIFNYLNLLVGGYTSAFSDWLWKASVGAYLDTEEYSLIDYTLYQGVIWGKYAFSRPLELDFGFIVEWGLSRNKVWPLIGFIYVPSPRWQINAVFPVDLSIDYTVCECLEASASLRFLRSRHRVQQNEPNSQGIFEYHATGAEFDLTYAPFIRFCVTGFLGSTLGGDLKISDRNDENANHLKFDGSFYAGVTALLSF